MKHTIIHLIAITTMGAVSAYAVNDWTLYYELPSSTSQEIVLSSTTGAGSESENGYWYTGSERTPEPP